MALKGKIESGHIPINKYKLSFSGDTVSYIFTKVSGIEQEIPGTVLPDRSKVSGGEPLAFEIVCELPLHHATQVSAIETWFGQCKDPVADGYRKTGTMEYHGTDSKAKKTFTLTDMWPTKLKYPDTDMSNEEGEMAVLEITFSVDEYAIPT